MLLDELFELLDVVLAFELTAAFVEVAVGNEVEAEALEIPNAPPNPS